MAGAPWIVSDGLWERIEPLLPARQERRFRYPGRKPASRIGRALWRDPVRAAHRGRLEARAPGAGASARAWTCWRRLDAWQRAGVWEKLHALLVGGAASGGRDLDLRPRGRGFQPGAG